MRGHGKVSSKRTFPSKQNKLLLTNITRKMITMRGEPSLVASGVTVLNI